MPHITLDALTKSHPQSLVTHVSTMAEIHHWSGVLVAIFSVLLACCVFCRAGRSDRR